MVYGETYASRIDSLLPQAQLTDIAEALLLQDVANKTCNTAHPVDRHALEHALGSQILEQILEPTPVIENLIRYGLEPRFVREEVPIHPNAQVIARILRNVTNSDLSISHDAAA